MQLLSVIAPVLFILQCQWVPPALADESDYTDITRLPVVGTVNVKGSSLRLYEVDGFRVAEPRISIEDTCQLVTFNELYLRHQILLPLRVEANALQTLMDGSAKVGHVTLTELSVRTDKALDSEEAKLTVMAQLTSADKGQLIFLCESFARCQRLKEFIGSHPEVLQRAIRIVPFGRIVGNQVRFGGVRSASPPRFNCPLGEWVVFQRRVDGSLSFAQNWDSYVKGFGNPEGNYWMGLDNLFAMTVTSVKNSFADSSRCQLRVEVEDQGGNRYWGEYRLFEVLDAGQNYRLRLGQEVTGSQFPRFVSGHNELPFSAYDRDNDRHGSSCSQLFGFGGWWFNACFDVSLNGAYTTDKSVTVNPAYASADIRPGQAVVMRNTLMKFKCF